MLTDRIMRIGLGRAAEGMHVNLLRAVPGLRIINDRTHGRYNGYVEQCRKLGITVPPSFVFVRNPWQWYVSLWCWRRYRQRPEISFQGTFREAMECIKENPSYWHLRSLTYSWQLHGAENAQYVGRMENLEDDTVRILRVIIPDLLTEQQIREHVQSDWAGRVRCPNGEYEDRFLDYHKYYDAELRDWVAKWDAELIGRFHYEF